MKNMLGLNLNQCSEFIQLPDGTMSSVIIKNQGSDNFANVYSNSRNSFYGITDFPTAFLDGLNPTVGDSTTNYRYSNYLPKVNTRMQVPSPYTISAVGFQSGNQFEFVVTVTKPEDDTNTNVKLPTVLTESHIPYVLVLRLTLGDYNNDGFLDILINGFSPGVFRNNGDGILLTLRKMERNKMSKKKDAPSPIEAYMHTKEERWNKGKETEQDRIKKSFLQERLMLLISIVGLVYRLI